MNDSANDEKLVTDIKSAISEAEAILGASVDHAEKELSALRGDMDTRLAGAKQRLLAAQQQLLCRTQQVARAADDYVRDNPWRSVAIAGGVGFMLRNLPIAKLSLAAVTLGSWWLSLDKVAAAPAQN